MIWIIYQLDLLGIWAGECDALISEVSSSYFLRINLGAELTFATLILRSVMNFNLDNGLLNILYFMSGWLPLSIWLLTIFFCRMAKHQIYCKMTSNRFLKEPEIFARKVYQMFRSIKIMICMIVRMQYNFDLMSIVTYVATVQFFLYF